MGAHLYTQLARASQTALVAAALALVLGAPGEAMAKFIQVIPGQAATSFANVTTTGVFTLPDGSTWDVTGAHVATNINLRNNSGLLTLGAADDVILQRGAVANRLEMRNGANIQAFRVYFDYTDASNYSYISMGETGNVNGLYSNGAGTGANGGMVLGSFDAGNVVLATQGVTRFFVSGTTGALLAGADNTYDIGISTALRPANGYFGTLVVSLDFRAQRSTADTVAPLVTGRKSRGTVSAPTVITTGDDLLDIVAEGYVGVNNTWQEAARIKFDSTGTISDSTTGIAGITRFLVAKTGAEPAEVCQVNGTDQHLLHVGTAPTITAGGGTNPSIAGTDEAFTITVGTGGVAASVTVTFANAFAVAPRCVANHQGAILLTRCVSATTNVVIDAATPFTASGLIDVICRSGTT